jgi:diguanylate cyclase
LRRRLHEDVAKLRQSVDEMRRENAESARRLETRIATFQDRLEAARKGSDVDRLTMLGSRRVAERHLQRISDEPRPTCVLLFDIDRFREINQRYGAPFGDKLLQAFAHLLRESFPEAGTLFRWGPDEFLAIAQGALPPSVERCKAICRQFAAGNYVTHQRGGTERVSATVAWGAVQYVQGKSTESLYLGVRELLEQNRRGVRP